MKVVLQEGEKVLFKENPKKSILVFWFFRALAIALVIPLLIMPLFMFTMNMSDFSMYPIWYLFFLIIILFLVFIYQIFLLKSYTFYITNERVILEGGILLRKIKNVPYHKITDVSIVQNIIERMLGISSLNVHTAGTGYQIPEIRFFGIEDPEKPQSIIVKELKIFKKA